MGKNIANPNGPQYGSGRRDHSTSQITLPSAFLTQAWNGELNRIGRTLSMPVILQQAARAAGFAWAVRAADLINEDTHKAMEEAIRLAEQTAFAQVDRGSNERE
ncbi:hypothetical protein [Pseudomonas sp. SED1]|uniref:hypothetical protein n=1 Tax=Pseudomonas sp. SED1 TaxID=3056845 RepID=UPI00296FFC12|nr:hypothetical protein [Pseudomonas sp. SED1]MDY0832718.1 hypothetical protein [Pseudomonas sp. SED1]